MGWINKDTAAGGEALLPALVGFKVYKTTTQAITPAGTILPVAWDAEAWDTENAVISGVFTVPAALNGKYMDFAAAVEYSTVENQELFLQYDDGGGYTVVARSGATTVNYESASWGPFLLTTGDKYRVDVRINGSTGTIQSQNRQFFSGTVTG